jgi:hypothetical protein
MRFKSRGSSLLSRRVSRLKTASAVPVGLDSAAAGTGSAEKPEGLRRVRHRLRMDRLDNRVRRRRQESVDQVGRGIGFDFVPQSPLNSVQMPANVNSGRLSSSANQTTSFLLVSGFGSGAYSAKLFAGTRQRFSHFL